METDLGFVNILLTSMWNVFDLENGVMVQEGCPPSQDTNQPTMKVKICIGFVCCNTTIYNTAMFVVTHFLLLLY